MIIGPCPSLGGRNLKCHVCAHRKRAGMAETEFGKPLWRYNQVWANIFNKPMIRDAGMWGDDLYVTLWHHHDPALTPLWHHADLFVTLLCEQCGHTHSATQSSKEVYLSWPVGGVLGERCDQVHFDPRPSILSPYPPHLLWVRLSSTCDLYTWPVSSQPSWPFDHILMSHMTTPWPWGLWWRHPGVTYTTRKPSDSTCTLIYVFVRWIDEKKNAFWTFSDRLIFYIDNFVFCCFKIWKRFLIYMDFMFPLTKVGTGRRPVQTVYTRCQHTFKLISTPVDRLTSLVFLWK